MLLNGHFTKTQKSGDTVSTRPTTTVTTTPFRRHRGMRRSTAAPPLVPLGIGGNKETRRPSRKTGPKRGKEKKARPPPPPPPPPRCERIWPPTSRGGATPGNSSSSFWDEVRGGGGGGQVCESVRTCVPERREGGVLPGRRPRAD